VNSNVTRPSGVCTVHDVRRRIVEGVAVREWGDPGEPGILMWPGLGATGGYFAAVAEAMPGRAVSVDPPGFGDSPPPEAYSYDRLVELAAVLIGACECHAFVGHSLGGFLGAAIASDPPPSLRAVVLVDGGHLGVREFAALGQPAPEASREELLEWVKENQPRFPDWDTAVGTLAEMIGGDVTPSLEAYAHEILVQADGEICDRSTAERIADLLSVAREHDPDVASDIAIPTLLIACAQPPESRAIRERAWRRFADASPQVELRVGEFWRHNPILQDPKGSSALIVGWLRAHL
jgi:pimeloyl-ACP methyl ester carboxylesterase